MKAPFSLWNRHGVMFYYRLRGGSWKSTGESSRAKAMEVAMKKAVEAGESLNGQAVSLKLFAADFFDWDRCPRIAHLRLKGRRISPEHAAAQRRLLKRYILADPLAELPIASVDRPAVDAFEKRLAAKLEIEEGSTRHRRLFNSVLVALSTVFAWGLRVKACRENPVGGELLSYKKQERGILTSEELRAAFPAEGPGPWGNLRDFCAFLLAAGAGLRRGELRALRWGDLDKANRLLTIHEAFKGGGSRLGETKGGRVRYAKLTPASVKRLEGWWVQTPWKRPEDFIFANDAGGALGNQWWEMAFERGMKGLGVDRAARSIVPHSLRHSLNSHLRAAGVPSYLIRESMGWTTETVQQVYSHVLAEHLEPIAKAVEGIIG